MSKKGMDNMTVGKKIVIKSKLAQKTKRTTPKRKHRTQTKATLSQTQSKHIDTNTINSKQTNQSKSTQAITLVLHKQYKRLKQWQAVTKTMIGFLPFSLQTVSLTCE